MRQFTGEELKALEEYESRFKSATELNFVRNLEPRYLYAIRAIYDKATETPSSLNATCSHCVLKFMKEVGKKYFADKKAYEEKAAQLVQALDQVFEEVPDEKPITKPKKTTKKNGKESSNKKGTTETEKD